MRCVFSKALARASFSLLFLLTAALPSYSAGAVFVQCWESHRTLVDGPLARFLGQKRFVEAKYDPMLTGVKYPEVPSVYALHLPKDSPQEILPSNLGLSASLTDRVIEEAREIHAFHDFKLLSDMKRKRMSAAALAEVKRGAQIAGDLAHATSSATDPAARAKDARRAYLRHFIENAYEADKYLTPAPDVVEPLWRVETGNPKFDRAFHYVEETLPMLTQRTANRRSGSGLPLPFPGIIAAPGRFAEQYYWDTYFGIRALIRTGRLELAMMQAENFLHMIQTYGHVPNGMRDYYLSRSQPPVVSSVIREVVEAALESRPEERERILNWVKQRALPLIAREHQDFWMATRGDKKLRLNFHSGDNYPRPERHGTDSEVALGKSYVDVQAAAESGLDFTDMHEREASRIAGPLLNSLLYKTESDLAWMSEITGDRVGAEKYRGQASARKEDFIAKAWNPEKKRFEYYHLDNDKRNGRLSAETFAPLFVGMLDKSNPRDRQIVEGIVGQLSQLEKKGGIAMSDATSSTHQWDGNNGWAPFQIMTVRGLDRYGYGSDAKRVAGKWATTVADIHDQKQGIYERANVDTGGLPIEDGTKYDTQRGFWWTNQSFVEMGIDYLGFKLIPRTPARR